MRKLTLALLVCGLGVFLVGCNQEAPAATDDQFQKDLAEAAAKNKGAPTKGRVMKPPTDMGKKQSPAADDGKQAGPSGAN